MASISALYKYLRKKKIINENPMEFMDRPRKDTDVVVQTFLTKEQVQLMKQKLEENGDLQLRLYVLLSLSTMARVNAISNIRWDQIDFDNRTINDVLEKEGKIVTLFYSNEVKNLLLQWKEYQEQQNMNSEYVFVTKYNGQTSQASVSTLSEWTKKVGKMINVPSLHCHDYRHSGATLLKQSGMSLESVSNLLNHAGTDVTLKHYIAQDKKKIQAEKDQFDII
jgi:integrase